MSESLNGDVREITLVGKRHKSLLNVLANRFEPGEIVMITTSALQTPKKWPGFMERARKASYSPIFSLRKFDGSEMGTHAPGDPKNPSLAIYRRKLHDLLFEYATELGIQMDFSARAMEFFETNDHSGVVLADGRRFMADIVVAANGVGSTSRAVIDGNKDEPISSGFIVYRIAFPAASALENPVIAKEFAGYTDRGFLYIGPGAHIVISKGGDDLCWLLTCKVRCALVGHVLLLMLLQDEGSTAGEDWSKATTTDKALEAVQGWEPFVAEIIKTTPNNSVMDWKLMWRDPQPQWASPGGRIVQVGDAAHPFLPTSFSGATMAMEDAYSLATCLSIAGKENAPLATKVHNHLRYAL
jgi:2-polyprenyl-6-methoxyphenol hydroxylase-like FAD-dependent oxidoreductase